MTPPKAPPDDDSDAPRAAEDEVARARALILKRRNRFIAAAIAGLGATNSACTEPSVCLDMAVPASGEGGGAAARTAPTPCLQMPLAGRGGAGGSGGSVAGKGGLGGMPSVCLSAPIDQCDNGAPPPCVCLEPPIDQDAGTEAPGEG